jgi:hypothetical protein
MTGTLPMARKMKAELRQKRCTKEILVEVVDVEARWIYPDYARSNDLS